MLTLLTAPMATDCESVILTELGELAGWCRWFADSDCCDTEAFRTVVRSAEDLRSQIPRTCAPLATLLHWVLVVFRARPADLNSRSVRAIASALTSVRTIWLEAYSLEQIRARLAEAGISL
ncbi:hypothetical protein FJY63_01280 [Candidatus Sumerlaeota bacterium]|nr:hypothetical protein [Candidatus Sumerlaeota bacterium]